MRLRFRTLLIVIAAVAAPVAVPAAFAGGIDEQRAAFREAYPLAELGDRDALERHRELLRDYPLWPDLEAAWLRARLDTVDHAEVRRFLERHDGLKPARTLRYRFALHLAEAGRHEEFLELYDAHYRELGVERLDCLALDATIATSPGQPILERARPLWLAGTSQVDACDPVFEHLKRTGQLGEVLHRERFELAIDAKSLSLARYLARSLPEPWQREAARWTAAYGEPRAFLERHRPADDSETYRRQLLAAVETLAYGDPVEAACGWQRIARDYTFTAEQRFGVERHIALWMARNHEPAAGVFLQTLPGAAVDTEVRRWRVRHALSGNDWPAVLAAIGQLPREERQRDAWQFWRAIALERTGDGAAAAPIFERLAADRSYYGFLAADKIGRDYDWSHAQLEADETILARLARQPVLVRARELYYTDLEGRGRSEWNAAVSRLTREEQLQAVVLAHRWGWHSRAIATAADLSRYDDLEIRYPLPWLEEFRRHSADAGVTPSWSYGIARSESLFMPDIRSGTGAIGIMQLMPSTGRRTAANLGEPYEGRATLTDAARNIRLGTSFLGDLYERFDNNRVLATAAYNAGPLRVDRWLPRAGDLDARIWIETVPYRETRDYVRRVLTAGIIFHWRLEGDMRRLSAAMPSIAAAPRVAEAGVPRRQ